MATQVHPTAIVEAGAKLGQDVVIGAYAYGWFFNVEPIAGVTPIENMLDDLRRDKPDLVDEIYRRLFVFDDLVHIIIKCLNLCFIDIEFG